MLPTHIFIYQHENDIKKDVDNEYDERVKHPHPIIALIFHLVTL